MLTLRDLVTEDESGLFSPQPDHLDVLTYYANAIEHLEFGNDAKAAVTLSTPSRCGPY